MGNETKCMLSLMLLFLIAVNFSAGYYMAKPDPACSIDNYENYSKQGITMLCEPPTMFGLALIFDTIAIIGIFVASEEKKK